MTAEEILLQLKQWVVDERNTAHVNCLEAEKQTYNQVINKIDGLLRAAQQTPVALPDELEDKAKSAAFDEVTRCFRENIELNPNEWFVKGAEWMQSNLSTSTGEGEGVAAIKQAAQPFFDWVKKYHPNINTADEKGMELYAAYQTLKQILHPLFKQQP